MKRTVYILASLFSLAALLGTAGASDLESISVLATFLATLIWTSLFVGFGVAALHSSQKQGVSRVRNSKNGTAAKSRIVPPGHGPKKAPREAATSTEHTGNNSEPNIARWKRGVKHDRSKIS